MSSTTQNAAAPEDAQYEGQYVGQYDSDDIFAPPPAAISWTDEGMSVTGYIVEKPVLIRALDFTTRKPKSWPDGSPVMTSVTVLDVAGERRSLWAEKPSALFNALKDATRAAGESMRVGGTLIVTFTHTEKPTRRGMNGQKIFTAEYLP